MSKQPFIVDCQVLQSGAKDRGMGKYSLELIRALLDSAPDGVSEFVFIFNANLDPNPDVEKAVKEIKPGAKIEQLSLQLAHNLFDTRDTLEKNKKLLDRYMEANGYSQPHYLILSLFLYEICPAFPTTANKLLLFYDLIPLLYYERYEDNEVTYPQNYLERFNIVFEADMIYTISQTVANDMAVFIGIPHEKLVDIDGASVDRTKLKPKQPQSVKDPKQKYILMPSGEDLRKNNDKGVEGFAAFNKKYGNDEYQLIVTSHFSEETQKKLQAITPGVIFAGTVSEEEFAWLYKNCASVFFPTEYEGLGMPILEAIDFNKTIACSNIAVFNEMSPSAFCYFDPHDENDMAQALYESLSFTIDTKEYNKVSKRFTWTESARKLYEGLPVPSSRTMQPAKKRIAMLCPDPVGFSAIGKVVMESHYAMSQQFVIDYYFDRGPNHKKVRTTFLPAVAQTGEAADFTAEKAATYDAVTYHIGNSEYHMQTALKALTIPGAVIFHDTNLEGLFNGMVEFGVMSEQRKNIEAGLTKLLKAQAKFVGSIVNNQLAAICHSVYAQTALQEAVVEDKITTTALQLPVSTSSFNAQTVVKRHINIGLAGILAEVKGTKFIDELLADKRFKDCKFFVIGHTFLQDREVRRLQKKKGIEFVGDPTDLEFQSYISKLDVLVNFREHYNGETSLSTLEAMRHGVIPVVRKIGWYDELPDDTVMKAATHSDVTRLVYELVADEKLRSKLSSRAQEYTAEKHSHAAYTRAIAAVLDSL